MKMERVIHKTCIRNLPYLQFSNFNGLIAGMHVIVNLEIDNMF